MECCFLVPVHFGDQKGDSGKGKKRACWCVGEGNQGGALRGGRTLPNQPAPFPTWGDHTWCAESQGLRLSARTPSVSEWYGGAPGLLAVHLLGCEVLCTFVPEGCIRQPDLGPQEMASRPQGVHSASGGCRE